MTSGLQLPLARDLAVQPARDLVADLDGESFAIDVRGLGARVVLQASDGRVGVDLRWQAAAQCRSRDTP